MRPQGDRHGKRKQKKKKKRPGIVAVELTAKEVRYAIEHAAWCAAVDDDPSISIAGSALVMRHRVGYRVRYKRMDWTGIRR